MLLAAATAAASKFVLNNSNSIQAILRNQHPTASLSSININFNTISMIPSIISSSVQWMLSSPTVKVSLFVYMAIEIGFYVAFYKYYIPKCNQYTKPQPYRDYGPNRCKLLIRIVKRIEKTHCCMDSVRTKEDKEIVTKKIIQFLSEWFYVVKKGQDAWQVRNNVTQQGKTKKTPTSKPSKTDLFSPRLCESQYSSASSSSASSTSSSTSPDNSDTDHSEQDDDEITTSAPEEESSSSLSDQTLPILCKNDIDEFFSWAFFGQNGTSLETWEQQELNHIYKELYKETGVSFSDDINTSSSFCSSNNGDRTRMKPRCMSLEPMNAFYRPLLVYAVVAFIKRIGGLFLRYQGFQRYQSQTGLTCWYRMPSKSPTTTTAAASTATSNEYLPLLFFHGIAPGGFVFYLPMVLWGLASGEKERPIYLFENNAISCSIDLQPLTEQETVDGVIEVLEKTKCISSSSSSSLSARKDTKLCLVGHSFGSCPVTWCLANPKLKSHICQVTLLDPVAIMLSEPDVMVNFLYAEQLDKIRMVASSELFTEYYLRRHFAWYNSELWLEDVPKSSQVLVCLSEQDEIVNSSKVVQEMNRMGLNNSHNMLMWNNVGHATCVTSPKMWKQIKSKMLQQELHLLQQQR